MVILCQLEVVVFFWPGALEISLRRLVFLPLLHPLDHATWAICRNPDSPGFLQGFPETKRQSFPHCIFEACLHYSATPLAESEPNTKSPEKSHDNPLESANLAFFHTRAVEGSCVRIVYNIGIGTVYGWVAPLQSTLEFWIGWTLNICEQYKQIYNVISILQRT